MGKFAFIVHPDRAADVPAANYLPHPVAEVLGRFLPPAVTAKIKVQSPCGTAEGWLISIRLTSRQIKELSQKALARRIIRAGIIAERLGAHVIGLGGSTIPVGRQVSGELNIPVAGGGGYTIAVALGSAEKALLLLGRPLTNTHAVVLNANSPVGSTCSLLLSRKVRSMTLVGYEKEILERLAGKILFHSGISARIGMDPERAVPSAQLVVAAPDARIDPRKLLTGSVFCDLTGYGAGQIVAGARGDVLAIQGGLVKMPGSPGNYSEPGFPPGMVSPRLAHTIILALENCCEKYLPDSSICPEEVDRVSRLARKHGFAGMGLVGPGGIIDPQCLESIKKHMHKNDLAAVSGDGPFSGCRIKIP